MAKNGKRCGICKYASWEITKGGQINHNKSGECHYKIVLPPLPSAIMHAIKDRWSDDTISLPRYGIHPTDGDDCPVYELRQGPPLSGVEYRQNSI